MLQQLMALFNTGFQMFGLVVLLIGVFLIIGGVVGRAGAGGFVKGGVLVLVGSWIAGIGSSVH